MIESAEEPESLLDYYRINRFNPVFIPLDNKEQLGSHSAKRHNLYERHLGIPIGLLSGRSVLEFGPNSGENALVLAMSGANMTLVEPNEQVIYRIKDLFDQFNLSSRIEIINSKLEEFDTNQVYDLVVAEGFLYTLANREDALRKMGSYIRPGCLGVISFNDRYGGFLEMLRRLLLFRSCSMADVESVHSRMSLEIAKTLYLEDFARLPVSRDFESWWKDTLINPFYHNKYLWSYEEILPILSEIGANFRTSSPMWSTFEHFTWYKKVENQSDLVEKIRANWRSELPYFVAGQRCTETGIAASDEVIIELEELMAKISELTCTVTPSKICPAPPKSLFSYLDTYSDIKIEQFVAELRALFDAMNSSKMEDLVQTYKESDTLRQFWGTPYHYICFQKSFSNPPESDSS